MNADYIDPRNGSRWRGIGWSVLLGVLIAAPGCVRFESRPLSSTANFDSFQARSLADPGLRRFFETNGMATSWPRLEWDLQALTMAAFYFHPDLDVARASLDLARAGGRTAAERPNPTLSVAPSYNTSMGIPSPWLVTAALDIPVETAGKRGYRIAEAGHVTEIARLNIGAVAWQVRSRLRRSLLDLYVAQETQVLLKNQQEVQGESLRLLELQHAEGAVSAFEVTQARIAADSTRLVLRDAERQQAEAQVAVANAVGLPSAALTGVTLSFAGLIDLPSEIPVESARRQALLNRPDVLAALAEYNASQSALQLEIAKQYPDIHFNPGYEFDQGDNKWSPGVAVTLPVFSRNKGPISEAEARRSQSAANFNALQVRVMGDIERAVAACHAVSQKGREAEAIQSNLVTQEKTARAMIEAGEISKSELIALRLQLSASALARLDSLTRAQLAFQQLEDVLQSPFGLPASLWQHPIRVAAAIP